MAELVEGDVASARVAIAGRYLGLEDGERFAADRRSRPVLLLRLVADGPRVWDLSGNPAILIDPGQHRPSGSISAGQRVHVVLLPMALLASLSR